MKIYKKICVFCNLSCWLLHKNKNSFTLFTEHSKNLTWTFSGWRDNQRNLLYTCAVTRPYVSNVTLSSKVVNDTTTYSSVVVTYQMTKISKRKKKKTVRIIYSNTRRWVCIERAAFMFEIDLRRAVSSNVTFVQHEFTRVTKTTYLDYHVPFFLQQNLTCQSKLYKSLKSYIFPPSF